MDSSGPEPPIAPFDHIPDHLLLLIFNKLFDAKSLVRCLSVSKRFASLIPLADAVFLPLFLPPRPSAKFSPSHGGSSVNFLKSLLSYVFLKPLHLFRRPYRSRPSESPTQCPPLLLNTFNHIKFLQFELHSHGGSVDADFLKWKATFGSQLKRCVVVCATSFHRGIPESEETVSPERSLTSEDLKSRIMWTISCLIAASARHFLLKQMLLKFPTLKKIVISDLNKQGLLRMEEEELEELRDSLMTEDHDMASFRPEQRVVQDLRMRMWYEPELKLPESGCVMKGATLLVISPTGEMAVAGEEGGDGGFDGDEAERAVFGEAEREIAKKKSSHVMEMTSF